MTTWVLVAAVFCASVEQGAEPVCRTIESDLMDIPKYYATRPACVSAVRGELEKTVAWMNESVRLQTGPPMEFQRGVRKGGGQLL